jgi:hypothetical protein
VATALHAKLPALCLSHTLLLAATCLRLRRLEDPRYDEVEMVLGVQRLLVKEEDKRGGAGMLIPCKNQQPEYVHYIYCLRSLLNHGNKGNLKVRR